ncbi:MAG: cation transporter [Planctomycetota bacterium]
MSSSPPLTRLHRRALRLEYFTLTWNTLEAVIAVAAGIAAGSTALIAFGADSVIELFAAAALVWRLRRAGPAASLAEHGAAERRALYVVAGTFFLLAAYVLFESAHALLSRAGPEPSALGLGLAIASLIVMPLLAYAKQRTARRIGSAALAAEAVETWVCAYLSLALLVGVGLHYAFGWWWADAVGAAGMLPTIVWQSWETLGEARENDDEGLHSDF